MPSSNGPQTTRSGNHSMTTHAQSTTTHHVDRLLNRCRVQPMQNAEGRQEATAKQCGSAEAPPRPAVQTTEGASQLQRELTLHSRWRAASDTAHSCSLEASSELPNGKQSNLPADRCSVFGALTVTKACSAPASGGHQARMPCDHRTASRLHRAAANAEASRCTGAARSVCAAVPQEVRGSARRGRLFSLALCTPSSPLRRRTARLDLHRPALPSTTAQSWRIFSALALSGFRGNAGALWVRVGGAPHRQTD